MINYIKRIETLEKMLGQEYLKELFKHIERSYDAMHRLEGGQIEYFVQHLSNENERTHRFSNSFQLANDKLGYDCIRALAVLNHHCQLCAEDTEAWHTRGAFCSHKKEVGGEGLREAVRSGEISEDEADRLYKIEYEKYDDENDLPF